MSRRNRISVVILAVLAVLVSVFVLISVYAVYAQSYGTDFTRLPVLVARVADAAIYSLEGRKLELGWGKTWLSDKPEGYSILLEDGSKMTKEDWIVGADAAIAYIDSLIAAINDAK